MSEEYKYVCPVCGKKYKQSEYYYKKHLATHDEKEEKELPVEDDGKRKHHRILRWLNK